MSGDLVRLQGYLSSHLISYILQGLRCLGGLLCHFANWFLGVVFSRDLGHHSYIGTPPHHAELHQRQRQTRQAHPDL